MEPVQVNQIIFVNRRNGFIPSDKKSIKRFVVTRVNATNFYARPETGKHEFRFHPVTMISKDSIGETLVAYLSEAEYWQTVKVEEERQKMIDEITSSLKSLSKEKLKSILKTIKNNDNKNQRGRKK